MISISHHAHKLMGHAVCYRCHQRLHLHSLHHQQLRQAAEECSVLAAGAGELKVGAEVRLHEEGPGRSRVTWGDMNEWRHSVSG